VHLGEALQYRPKIMTVWLTCTTIPKLRQSLLRSENGFQNGAAL
jgi:hypothetical protein